MSVRAFLFFLIIGCSSSCSSAATRDYAAGKCVLWREEREGKVTQVLLAKWMRRLQRQAGLK